MEADTVKIAIAILGFVTALIKLVTVLKGKKK